MLVPLVVECYHDDEQNLLQITSVYMGSSSTIEWSVMAFSKYTMCMCTMVQEKLKVRHKQIGTLRDMGVLYPSLGPLDLDCTVKEATLEALGRHRMHLSPLCSQGSHSKELVFFFF